MTDAELIAKLRTAHKNFDEFDAYYLARPSSDRIEQLVATNEQLLKQNETLERELESVYYDISMNAGET